MPAADAMAPFADKGDLWVGIPRTTIRETRSVLPGVGEWAIYRSRQRLANGSLLLEGPGPGAEGVGGVGRLQARRITRAQCFRTCADPTALDRLCTALSLDRLAHESSSITKASPLATLVFGGGSGPAVSIIDGHPHNDVLLGMAVLGAAGNVMMDSTNTIATSDNPQPQRPTLIHRQALGMVVLFANTDDDRQRLE